jgi:hypothetical protein
VTLTAHEAYVAAHRVPTGPPSREADRVLRDLMDLPPPLRRPLVKDLPESERWVVLDSAARSLGTCWGIYQDDPVGFVEDVLGENLWSKPREILSAIPHERYIAVPSCFSSSKSWSLSRGVLWFSLVHPVGTARVVTLAPLWRQVSGIMWGQEIRGAHSRAALPGVVGAVQYKVQRNDKSWYKVAEGVVGNARNESTIQGIHAPHVLLLVDEAGGIPHGVGRNLRALLTNEDTRMVAIGNPAADNEGSWFETYCLRKEVKVIPISAFDTPAFTGEQVGRCRSCPAEVSPHTLTKHLVQRSFAQEVIDEYGNESPYVQAKIYARFPRGGSWRILPSAWVDASAAAGEPGEEEDYVRLCDLGLPGETSTNRVYPGAWIRLGVDIASDGGDEFVVARTIGDMSEIRTITSGIANEDALAVAGRIKAEIIKAERLRVRLGTEAKVRVKVDRIGVGWGVVSTLKAWAAEGQFDAEIIGVSVAEAWPDQSRAGEMTPFKQRDAMWIAMRDLVKPQQGPEGDEPALRLRVDRKTLAQLSSPTYSTSSNGKTVVESKDSMRKRGISSPDRAEAVLLSVFEPPPPQRRRPRPRVIVN